MFQPLRLLFLFLVISSISLMAQDREKFTEANLLSEDGIYGLAIPIWEDLVERNPDNANMHYKLGRSYLDLEIDRERALPYLKKASKNIKRQYDPFSFSIKTAPEEVLYYLGYAYHLASDIDSAEFYYKKFLETAVTKHYLRPDAEKNLRMCANARELMANPMNVEIDNIGGTINSEYSDYAPIISPDENTMYFTSRRLREDKSNASDMEAQTGFFYEDMYVSYRDVGGEWSEPVLLENNESQEHTSVVSISTDGSQMFVYKTYNGKGNLYQSDYTGSDGWGPLALIGSDVNSEANEYFATLTADGQRLYFTSDRKGGLGGKDIWYVQRLPNGEWGKALNMGAPINTAEDEDAPFLHPDGKTMYFSSNGHKSMGGYDIFYSQRDKAGVWSDPVNIGYPLNTTDDDVCYVTTPSGNTAYYSTKSKNSLGSSDVYRVDYKEEDQMPEYDMSGFAVLKGWILTTNNEPLPDNIRIEISKKDSDKMEGVARPVARNGSFVFIIASGLSYDINYFLGDEVVYTETVDIPSGTEYQEIPREIFLTPKAGGGYALSTLKEDVLGNVERWSMKPSDSDGSIPIGSSVYFYDKQGQVTDTAIVSSGGFFQFRPETSDEPFILKPALADASQDDLDIELLDANGNPKTISLKKADDGKYYEKGKLPKKEKLEAIAEVPPTPVKPEKPTTPTAPTTSGKSVAAPGGAKEFYLFFDYNQVEMEDEDPTFAAAMAAMRTIAQNGGTPKVRIEASASRVPTSAFATNDELAKARLKMMEQAVKQNAGKFSFSENDLSFKELEFLVQGPAYNAKSPQEKALFIEYQYVRIVVN